MNETNMNILFISFIGNYEQAQEFHQKAIEIIVSKLGPEHPKVGFFTSNLADIFRKRSE